MGRSQGTFILRYKGCYYKVISVRHVEENWWIFECKTLDKKEDTSFRFQLSGMWEALDKACTMKSAKDILLMDLDQQGRWKICTQDELDKLMNRKRRREGQRAILKKIANLFETHFILGQLNLQ